MHSSQATPHILVVQPHRATCFKIIDCIRLVNPKAKVAHAIDLSEAYNLSEHAQPDLVILDQSHAHASGLQMFFSLLNALAIDWFILSHGRETAYVSPKNQVHLGQLTDHLKTTRAFRKGRHFGRDQVAHMPRPGRLEKQTDDWKVVVIGASTGGIEALIEVLSNFPKTAPPTVIVQHINASFLPGLAQRLDRLCAATVREAQPKDRLTTGQILLAPGEEEHLIITDRGRRCELRHGPPQHGHRPSVDVLFRSAAEQVGADCVGVLLSGMGRDGARGLLEIQNRGGWTIAQDEATCAVYGMPRAAVEMGAVREQQPDWNIAQTVLKAATKPKQKVHDA